MVGGFQRDYTQDMNKSYSNKNQSVCEKILVDDPFRGFYSTLHPIFIPIVIGDYNNPRTGNPELSQPGLDGMVEGCSSHYSGFHGRTHGISGCQMFEKEQKVGYEPYLVAHPTNRKWVNQPW